MVEHQGKAVRGGKALVAVQAVWLVVAPVLMARVAVMGMAAPEAVAGAARMGVCWTTAFQAAWLGAMGAMEATLHLRRRAAAVPVVTAQSLTTASMPSSKVERCCAEVTEGQAV
ncbi:hypothetical protein [uncultured Nitratireductor sp.]|uniref:hypothetical protein n=1 Tax=uncultured Nitratireductor sp. TaxID=520953 RepID=UPI0025D2BDBD|nr:hypothetical protein [uncultured Nitratireductor sp.]